MKLRAFFAVVTGMVAAFMALFGLQGSASAAPASGVLAYPQTVCSSISVSTTNPALGELILVDGQAFRPNALVKLELSLQSGGPSTLLKTVTSDSQGAFQTSVRMPSSTASRGKYVLTATSGYETAGSCPADPSVNLNVGLGGDNHHRGSTGGATTGHGTDDASGHNGTAFTGLDVLLLVLIAVALVAAGGEMVRRNRRRSSVH